MGLMFPKAPSGLVYRAGCPTKKRSRTWVRGGGARARDRDHRLLRFEHFGKLDRAACLDLVANAIRRTCRHTAEEAFADALVDALERLAKNFAIDVADEAAEILARVGKNALSPINASAIVRRDATVGSNGLGIDVRMWAGAPH